MNQKKLRDEFIATIDHIESIRKKLTLQMGRGKAFVFPDHHKIAEGLFLSAWSHWEEFLREVFVSDLSSLTSSSLRKEIKKFRTKNAPGRLAEMIVGHPDERRWVEWSDFDEIAKRGDLLLGPTNRYRQVITAPSGAPAALSLSDLTSMKRVRNAIAHKSDHAWSSFRSLATGQPFNLSTKQLKGITVGRFLISHKWDGNPVLATTLTILRQNAQVLVP